VEIKLQRLAAKRYAEDELLWAYERLLKKFGAVFPIIFEFKDFFSMTATPLHRAFNFHGIRFGVCV